MDSQNVANMLLQLLAGNAQPLLTAMAAGQSSQPSQPAPSAPLLPPASTHPSVLQSQPTVSAPAAPAPIPSVPVIQPYHSLRTAPSSLPVQLPPLPQLASSSSASLTSVVNQARLSHAASSLPRQPALPRRRPRGTATAPPSLPRVPDIASCLTTSGNSTTIRTLNLIYPPQENGSEGDLYFMRFLSDTFIAVMNSVGLVVVQTSETTLSLTAHIQNIVHELRSRQFELTSPSSTLLQAHENQALAPLYVVNRGVPRPSDNQIRLRRAPVRGTETLGEVAANRTQFAVPSLCITTFEGQNCLLLHFVMRQPTVTASFSLPGDHQTIRRHHCLSQRIYTMFPRDRVHEPYPHADGDSSCGESDDDDDLGLEVDDDGDDEFENLRESPAPAQPTRVLRSITTGALGRTHAPLPSPTVPPVVPFPQALWSNEWNRPSSEVQFTTMFSSHIYEAATSGTPPLSATYRGHSVDDVAEQFLAKVGHCVDGGDFTSVLLVDQSVLITDPDNGRVVSSGEGIMREVLYAAFQKTLETSDQWLTTRADSSLSLLSIRSAGFGTFSSGPRQRMIGIGAAMWSLLMIKGLAPYPISVGLLQFLLNDCDFNSLTRDFLSVWHPLVRAVGDSWVEAGPTGDISTPTVRSHLAAYLGLELSSLVGRDQPSHDAIGLELVYRSVVGSEPPSHPDVQATARNFRLPCRNGFTVTRYLRGFVGGSDRFLSNVMASVVGPLALTARLSITAGDDLAQPIAEAMGGESLADMLYDYFTGSGIPCPTLFEEARSQGLFPSVVDLNHITDSKFRSQMWSWAISGSPFLARDSGSIKAGTISLVVLVDDNDALYLGGKPASLRPALLASGTVSFRTCFLEARIPASFLLKAARATYPTTEAPTRRLFIHHWLLCQSLNGIAAHTFS
ncbi:hypothetical protein R3P38DRAFT_3279919 [Favolaschia claudopus]|uniref:Uncharacterized protein n=1 Tax=Favolaschia claudopus TaxID=2862362 RepID=A0AAW0AHW0_9AGAR